MRASAASISATTGPKGSGCSRTWSTSLPRLLTSTTATPAIVPAYPKKLPTVLIAAFAAFALSAGFTVTGALLGAPPETLAFTRNTTESMSWIAGGLDLRPGDEVTLLGREGDTALDAQQIAKVAGTISYSILCNISARVRRVYV